jgi:hypothetical protein
MEKFLRVIIEPRTYLNIIYLLASFPLGIFYFVFMLTGLLVGFALLVIWIGIPILLFMLAAWYGFILFEREQARYLLGAGIRPFSKTDDKESSIWNRFTRYLGNPVTWKGLAYLFIKFPFGIINFVVLVTLVSVSLVFIASPVLEFYDLWDVDFIRIRFWETWILAFAGVIIAFISLHLFNFMAEIQARFAEVMLNEKPDASRQVVSSKE